MSVASVLFDVLGPVVLIVAVGAIVGTWLTIDGRSLSRLAYWVLGPAFMFDILHDAALAGSLILRLSLAGLAGMAAAGMMAAVVLWPRQSGSITSAGVLTAAYGNVGNAGLAISSFAFGSAILPAAGVFMLAINTSGMMLGVGLAHGRRGSLRRALWQALIAPMTLASLAGLAANGTEVTIPPLFDRSVSLVAGALIPVMLFTLGLELRQWGGIRLDVAIALPTVAKLVVAPVAAGLTARALGLGGDMIGVSIIQSAMPPAVFCMVLAMEHDLEPETVTSTVVVATLASLLSLPFVLLVATSLG